MFFVWAELVKGIHVWLRKCALLSLENITSPKFVSKTTIGKRVLMIGKYLLLFFTAVTSLTCRYKSFPSLRPRSVVSINDGNRVKEIYFGD